MPTYGVTCYIASYAATLSHIAKRLQARVSSAWPYKVHGANYQLRCAKYCPCEPTERGAGRTTPQDTALLVEKAIANVNKKRALPEASYLIDARKHWWYIPSGPCRTFKLSRAH